MESLDQLFADIDNADDKHQTPLETNQPTAEEKATKAEEKRQEELSDIQKELEAKFDELFGSIEP